MGEEPFKVSTHGEKGHRASGLVEREAGRAEPFKVSLSKKGVGPGGMEPWGHGAMSQGPLKSAQSQLIEDRGMGSGG